MCGLSGHGVSASGVRGMPVETTEQIAPILFWRKEYRTDSGRRGRQLAWRPRPDHGHRQRRRCALCHPRHVRARRPPRSRPRRRWPGRSGWVGLASGAKLRAKGHQTVPAGERLRLMMPGGGGPLGKASERDPMLVAADVRDGLVTVAAAARDYRVAVDEAGQIDAAATAPAPRRNRASPSPLGLFLLAPRGGGSRCTSRALTFVLRFPNGSSSSRQA